MGNHFQWFLATKNSLKKICLLHYTIECHEFIQDPVSYERDRYSEVIGKMEGQALFLLENFVKIQNYIGIIMVYFKYLTLLNKSELCPSN